MTTLICGSWRSLIVRLFVFQLFFSQLCFAPWAYAAVEVIDDDGTRVSLVKPAQRIISLAPNITEVLFHIGAGDQIVGVDEYSNYPPEAEEITRVNNYAAANYELIVSLRPDIVIAWQSGNGERIIQRIRELGIPVFLVESRELDDIPKLFDRLGQLSGHTDQAERSAAEFEQVLDELRSHNRDKPAVRVFYQIWSDPLITLNGQHMVSDVIELCGGINVFADAIPLVPYTNIESVLALSPQVIISGGSEQDQIANSHWWKRWSSIPAVQDRHIYAIPADLMQRHSDRILEGARMMCDYLDRARVSKPEKSPL
jgi:iron complex transport system substrate-binding protein